MKQKICILVLGFVGCWALIVSNALAANQMPTDSYSFTVVADTTSPYTTGHSPAKNVVNVPLDANIIVHVKDDGIGVDRNTIAMKVNGVTVSPAITGAPADYTLTYNPSTDFINGQVVAVTVDASDLAN